MQPRHLLVGHERPRNTVKSAMPRLASRRDAYVPARLAVAELHARADRAAWCTWGGVGPHAREAERAELVEKGEVRLRKDTLRLNTTREMQPGASALRPGRST